MITNYTNDYLSATRVNRPIYTQRCIIIIVVDDDANAKQESCAIAKMTAQCALYMGALKIFGTPWLRPRLLFQKWSGFCSDCTVRKSVGESSRPSIRRLYQHSFARNFRLQFPLGVANPQFWGMGGRRGSEMVPFERALVDFYRPSIVTFPLSLRVLEILPLLFSSMPLFPYILHHSLPKIFPCSPWSRWVAFWLQRAKVLG